MAARLTRCLAALVLAATALVAAESSAVDEVLRQAQVALDRDATDEAIALLADVESDDARVAVLLGLAHQRSGDPAAAAVAYRRALATGEERPDVAAALVACLVEGEDWEAAEAALAAHVDMGRCAVEMILVYGQAARRRGDLALARHVVDGGIVRFPRHAGLRRLLVGLAIAQEDYAIARRHLLALLAEAPDDATLWRWHLACAESDDERRRAAQAAVLAAPDDPELRRYCAELCSAAGHHAVALEHAQAALAAGGEDYR
ncbi:MAG: hypothetical protein ACYTF0_08440, partial [Planctomycetota bacterium]